jgi:hypothetical protein
MEEGWNQSLDRLAEHLGEVKGAISMAENHKENIKALPLFFEFEKAVYQS